MEAKITVIGGITEDARIIIPGKSRDLGQLCLPRDEKILSKQVSRTFGGGGLNVAIGLARLKQKVDLVGAVGDDLVARAARKHLLKEKVKPYLATKKNQATALTFVVHQEKQTRLLEDKAANDYLTWKDIARFINKAKVLVITHLSGLADSLVNRIAHNIKSNNDLYWLPGTTQIKNGYKKYLKFLKKKPIVLINQEEILTFIGFKSRDKLKQAAETILKKGAKLVIITLGSKGVNSYYIDKKVLKIHHLSVNKTGVIDPVGAGDAFSAAFIAYYQSNKNLLKALKAGTINAEAVLKSPGAINGLLNKKALAKILKKSTKS